MIKVENEVTVSDLAAKYCGKIGNVSDLQLAMELLVEEFGLVAVTDAVAVIRSIQFELDDIRPN